MKKVIFIPLLLLISAFILSGCILETEVAINSGIYALLIKVP
jgi:hypothetical protein